MFLPLNAFSLDVGDQAPEIVLPSIYNGEAINTHTMKGNVIYIDFWASWCLPCRQSFPAYNDLYTKYKDQGLVIYAINLDERLSAARKFLKKIQVDFHVVYDIEAKTPSIFDLPTMPSSFLVNREGTIVDAHYGYYPSDIEDIEEKIVEVLKEPIEKKE